MTVVINKATGNIVFVSRPTGITIYAANNVIQLACLYQISDAVIAVSFRHKHCSVMDGHTTLWCQK